MSLGVFGLDFAGDVVYPSVLLFVSGILQDFAPLNFSRGLFGEGLLSVSISKEHSAKCEVHSA